MTPTSFILFSVRNNAECLEVVYLKNNNVILIDYNFFLRYIYYILIISPNTQFTKARYPVLLQNISQVYFIYTSFNVKKMMLIQHHTYFETTDVQVQVNLVCIWYEPDQLYIIMLSEYLFEPTNYLYVTN